MPVGAGLVPALMKGNREGHPCLANNKLENRN